MTAEIASLDDITLDLYRRVAFLGETVSFSSELLSGIDRTRDDFMGYLLHNNETPVYGVNVGAGDGSFTSLRENERGYSAGLNSATSFGRPLPERVVRGIVLARLSSFVSGTGAVSAGLTEHVAEMLQAPLPTVPAEGTRGSGEILPLGHLFGATPRQRDLGVKEAMALVNGAPSAAALASDIALRSREVLRLAEQVFALACDSLSAPEAHFDEALGDVWGYSQETAALERLRDLLRHPSRPRRTHQARVSVRILPRCIAAADRAVEGLADDADTALRHPGDNPVFVDGHDPQRARALSNGSFHNQQVLVAIDGVTRACADLTILGQHFVHNLYQDREALPNQDNLALGVSYMVAADWSEDARRLATPSMLSFAAVGQNDVPFPVFPAWRSADAVLNCLTSQLAILAALSSQSLHATERQATPALQGLLERVREVMPPVTSRRDVGNDLHRLAESFSEWSITAAANGPVQQALAS